MNCGWYCPFHSVYDISLSMYAILNLLPSTLRGVQARSLPYPWATGGIRPSHYSIHGSPAPTGSPHLFVLQNGYCFYYYLTVLTRFLISVVTKADTNPGIRNNKIKQNRGINNIMLQNSKQAWNLNTSTSRYKQRITRSQQLTVWKHSGAGAVHGNGQWTTNT